jgi:hypothetical protein
LRDKITLDRGVGKGKLFSKSFLSPRKKEKKYEKAKNNDIFSK